MSDDGTAERDDILARITRGVVADAAHLRWHGLTDRYGRALVRFGGRELAVRRELWQAAGGDIPPGSVVWGTCDLGDCVAPEHSRLFARAVARSADFDRYLAARLVADGQCLILPGKTNRVRLDRRRIPIGKAVWEHAHGPVPAGWMVCHRCDRHQCGRLEHLYVALPVQRVRDSIERNRFPLGEQVSQAKLTWAAVDHIRGSTESRETLARQYGVSATTIFKVRTGKSWRTRPADDAAAPIDPS